MYLNKSVLLQFLEDLLLLFIDSFFAYIILMKPRLDMFLTNFIIKTTMQF